MRINTNDTGAATTTTRTRSRGAAVSPRAILVGAGLTLAGCGFVMGLKTGTLDLSKPRAAMAPAAFAPEITETLRGGDHPDLPKVAPVARPSLARLDLGVPRRDAPAIGDATLSFFPPRLFAGAPPVVPPSRPDRFTFEGPRPRLRPEGLVPAVRLAALDAPAEAPDDTADPDTETVTAPAEADTDAVTDIAAAPPPPAEAESDAQALAGLGTSLRPRLRPEGLKARAVAEAPEAPDPEAEVIAAAAVPDTDDGVPDTAAPPVLHDPTLQLARASNGCPRRLTRDIPRRRGNAPGGQAFMAKLASVGGIVRDGHVAGQILSGNMPDSLRRLAPVSFSGRLRDGNRATLTLCVTPDYLALGGNRDFVRVPLGLRAATRIAERFDMILPTAQMVDLIYRAADVRLTPRPMPPGPQMTSTAYLVEHNATVEGQRRRAGASGAALISGHKKDLVLTNRITRNPSKVAIYGWHRPGGKPIQPLSTVHGAAYADYSHGVRLVSRTAFLDGRAVDLRQLMSDPQYAALVSGEGPIRGPRLLMASLAGN